MPPSTPTPRRLAWIAAPAVAILLAAGCGDDDTADTTAATVLPGDTTTTGDVVDDLTDDLTDAGATAQSELEDALRAAGLTNLASAVSQVDLSGVLADNEFTVFAPSDDAFLALDSGDLTALLADPGQILDVLQNHLVVGERLTADDLVDQGSVTTEAGNSLQITDTAGTIAVDGAIVTSTETVGDGIIHVIDQVLLAGASS
jgi:transforming growth factor-beta-induced protein